MARSKDFELALRVRAEMKQAMSSLSKLERELYQTGTAADKAGTQAGQTGHKFDALGRNAKTAETRMSRLGRAAKSAESNFRGLGLVVAGAFAVHEITRFTQSMVDANTAAQRIHYTFQQAFGKDAHNQLEFVTDLSNKLGLSLKETAESYGALGASAQGTGVQAKDLQKLFQGLSEAATVLHTPASELNATFIQLAQGISLGKLQMQDIRAISQHLPGTMSILQEAARRLGTTLEDALAHGGLDARKAIAAIGEVAHERFGVQAKEASHSLNAELNRLHSTLFELQTDGTGFADTFAAAIDEMVQSLNDPAVQQGIQSLVKGLGEIVTWSVKVAAKMGDALAGIKQFSEYLTAQDTGFVAGTVTQQQTRQAAALKKRTSLVSGYNRDANTLHLGFVPGVQHNGQAALDYVNTLARRSANAKIDTSLSDKEQQRQFEVLAALKRSNDDFIKTYQDSSDQLIQKMVTSTRAANLVLGQTLAEAQDRQKRVQELRGSGALDVGSGLPSTPSVGGGGGGGNSNASARAKALAIAKQAAAANQQLTDTYNQLRGAIDPVVSANNKYNATMAKATAAADKAKQARGANVAQIDKTLAAIQMLAAGARDAAIDAIAEKDRKAWEKLQDSLRTPLQVNVDNALEKLRELKRLFDAGKTGMTQAQYLQAARQIGAQSGAQTAGTAPQYAGITNDIGPLANLGSQINQNTAALQQLDAWYQAQLAAAAKFNGQSEAQKAAHAARMAEIDKQYAAEKARIDQSRNTLALQAASGVFGQLAQLQSSHNAKQARIGKAAAIAQAVINTYQSATGAYASLASIPYIGPVLGAAAAAAAIAAGLANVQQIRSQPVGGYAEGGYTGAGGKHQVAGVVHAGEVVWSQDDIARAGGVGMVEAWRRGLPGYAAGGVVNPLANAPSPAELGFQPPAVPRLPTLAPSGDGGNGRGTQLTLHNHNYIDIDDLRERILTGPDAEHHVVNHVLRNGNTIKQEIS